MDRTTIAGPTIQLIVLEVAGWQVFGVQGIIRLSVDRARR